MTANFKFTIYNLQFTIIRLVLISLAFIFTFYIVHSTFLKPAFAVSSTPSTIPSVAPLQPTAYSLPPVVSPTSPLYTDLLVNNLFHSFSCLAIGQSVIGQPCLSYQVTKNAQGMVQGIPVLSQVNTSGGVLGTTTNLIGMLYQNPPVNTGDYLASVGQGLGIIKEAHAQVGGSGAAVLNPILTLWQASRNISYVIMIIIFLVIGLMVMFRNRINPQTVITAQTALPGLVIGLILITFSYFLAGLLSDMAFLGTNIVGFYFQSAQQGMTVPANLVQQTSNQSVLNIFSKFVGLVSQGDAAAAIDTIFNSVTPEVQSYLRIFAGIIAFQFTSQLGGAIPLYGGIIGGILGAVSAIVIQTDISGILGFVVSLVAVAVLIYTMFRLLLRLINNYLTIIFLTITAPFQFLAASLPGRQGIATSWVLNMLCNILAFPAIMAIFYFVNYLLGSATIINTPFAVSATPALTGTSTFPLLGGMNLSFLRIVVAFGALLVTPSIPDIICKAIGRMGQTGQLIGQEISGGIRGGRGYIGQVAGGAGRGAQSLGTGIFGESSINPYTGKPYVSRWGLRHYFSPPKPPTIPPGGGAAPAGPGAPCLPPETLIATPFGPKAVKDIAKGDLVWTISFNNKILQTTVKQIIRRKTSKTHRVLKIVLADSRILLVSPGHPDAFGRDLALLKKGNYLDGSLVIKSQLLPYSHRYTYDILPEGKTGAYFANNILIGSTLKVTQNKSLNSEELNPNGFPSP